MNKLSRVAVIRRANADDIPRGLEIAREAYPGRFPESETESVTRWVQWHLRNPWSIVLVGSEVIGIAMIELKHGFLKKAHVDLLARRPTARASWQTFSMVRTMARWAAFTGAQGAMRLDADTGVDFGPFAARLGGREVDPKTFPRYEIPIDGEL